MKKTVVAGFLLAALFLAPSDIIAASIYDGIWQMQGHSRFISVHVRDGVAVAVQFDNELTGLWQASMGTLNGNTVRLKTIVGYSYINAVADVTFTSPNTARSVQRSCSPIYPGFTCGDPNGTTYNYQKIF